MNNLTVFQERCENFLLDALGERGVHEIDRSVEGESEKYIVIKLPKNDAVVWIYSTEPELCVKGEYYMYELSDYPDEVNRISVFVGAVIALLEGRAPIDKGSNRAFFFKGGKV